MHFVADLHIHSRYARATSRALNPENLHRWAALKGVTVVGTGDFTHPLWFAELQEKLEPVEDGLYRLKEPWRSAVEQELPEACRQEVRFLLSVEISSIYKKHGRTRKVHNLLLLPDLATAATFNSRLGAIGNLKSDGRPILGLDSYDLLALSLEVCPEALFIPAHIWTPHFAVLGSESGFDDLEECFDDLLPAIFALETGLSSDPPMNSRLSRLDRFAMVSNSDAHSPHKLAREATCFATDLSYRAIYKALQERDGNRFTGTLEFYPEEGKYHYDGHRKCQVRWQPAQTLQANGRCPVCGGKLTVGVLHRVERLADRAEDARPPVSRPFAYIIPLPEVIGAALEVGPETKRATAVYRRLLEQCGPELHILRHVSPETIARCGEPLVAEALRRMRTGEIDVQAGYDGEYGTIRVFSEAERAQLRGQTALFALPARSALPAPAPHPVPSARVEPLPAAPVASDLGTLDQAQQQAVSADTGPVIVLAGPGSGKTRTLTQRIAYLLQQGEARSDQILAVTFTRRAAAEMRQRLQVLLPPERAAGLCLGTFHRLALDLMQQYTRPIPTLLDAWEARQLLGTARQEAGLSSRALRLASAISRAKAAGLRPEALQNQEPLAAAYAAYQEQLRLYHAWDYDDILLECLTWLETDAAALASLRQRFPYLLVDEFQDVNAVQYRLLRLLAGDGRGLFVIGDPDQAIYGFRGADPGYFTTLKQDFPQAYEVYLGTNYRSTATIVQASQAVIAQLPQRQPWPVRAHRATGASLQLYTAASELAEGIAVVRQISRMVGGADMVQADQHGSRAEHTRSFSDFGVLVRTGQQATLLEQCFLQEGLPYRLIGQSSFLEARAVREALALSRYLVQPAVPLRLLQVLGIEAFRPGQTALQRVRQWLRQHPADSPDLAACMAAVPAARAALQALAQTVMAYQPLLSEPPVQLLQRWQSEFGDPADADFLCLLSCAERATSLAALLDTVVLGQEADYEYTRARGPRPAEAVSIMTMHAAKGIEFPVVLLCGVEAGLLPVQAQDTDIAEERRLFYVALTRARDVLILLRARTRQQHGKRLQPALSPFVRDIPPGLWREEDVDAPRPTRQTSQLTLF
ncbi:MAG: UvrD-helicase domain-containing protein [Candidatus Tectimicrobiota bacterium]